MTSRTTHHPVQEPFDQKGSHPTGKAGGGELPAEKQLRTLL
jgi:hypothetical protein